jgi:hypothetical protein
MLLLQGIILGHACMHAFVRPVKLGLIPIAVTVDQLVIYGVRNVTDLCHKCHAIDLPKWSLCIVTIGSQPFLGSENHGLYIGIYHWWTHSAHQSRRLPECCASMSNSLVVVFGHVISIKATVFPVHPHSRIISQQHHTHSHLFLHRLHHGQRWVNLSDYLCLSFALLSYLSRSIIPPHREQHSLQCFPQFFPNHLLATTLSQPVSKMIFYSNQIAPHFNFSHSNLQIRLRSSILHVTYLFWCARIGSAHPS